jgi:hypothetical protein
LTHLGSRVASQQSDKVDFLQRMEEQLNAADHANGTCFASLVQRFTALRIVE